MLQKQERTGVLANQLAMLMNKAPKTVSGRPVHKKPKIIMGTNEPLRGVTGTKVDGVNVERLDAIADLIEKCPMRPVQTVNGEHFATLPQLFPLTSCIGFTLSSDGKGFGTMQCETPPGQRWAVTPGQKYCEGYWLTGWGMIAWAWKAENGFNSVVDPQHIESLFHVLSATPVDEGKVPGIVYRDVTPKRVALALRAWLDLKDAELAWLQVIEDRD